MRYFSGSTQDVPVNFAPLYQSSKSNLLVAIFPSSCSFVAKKERGSYSFLVVVTGTGAPLMACWSSVTRRSLAVCRLPMPSSSEFCLRPNARYPLYINHHYAAAVGRCIVPVLQQLLCRGKHGQARDLMRKLNFRLPSGIASQPH